MLNRFKREDVEQETALPILPKRAIQSGKLLLMAGLGLAVLVVLETQQQMVRALDLTKVSLPIELGQSSNSEPTQRSIKGSNQLEASESATPQVELSPQTLAIDIGSTNSTTQPSVAAVDPRHMQIPQWRGASFPVENFQTYTSPFGYRLAPTGSYTQEFHYGLDMAAPEGSYIRNWWSGKVVEVSDDSNCGTSVVVESGNWTHIYCHMQGHVEADSDGRRYLIDRSGGLQIWENQQVVAGTRIGRVGMTGRTTGPHLHWGLKYDSNWVDPALVLRAMYAEQQNAAR